MTQIAAKAGNPFLFQRVENILQHLQSDGALEFAMQEISSLNDQ